jgi:hypothetical protein
MAKAKSKAIVMAADETGGMTQVQDRRFENPREWPSFEVPKEQADTWLHYLSTQCQRRGWGCNSFGQVDRKENSGSITISTGGPDQPQLAIVWERKRGGPIKVRYRSAGTTEFLLTDAQELFRKVNELCRTNTKERVYCHGQLVYEGLAWRGELWLDDLLRLSPPARQDETYLLAPRVILIDAQVDGIDAQDALSAFTVRLRELSVFLSVVMRREVQVPPNSRCEWTYTLSLTGQVECDVRFVGYCELNRPTVMPTRGQAQTVPLVPVHRPDYSLTRIVVGAGNNEQQLPADIIDLWQAFMGLSPARRQQFLQVGSMWQAALSLGHEYQTAWFAWTVAACEALKPPEPQYRDHNVYYVIESLLGKPTADLLKEQWFQPQNVRNAHFHSGEFRGSEFVPHAWMASFQDPTFDHASRVLTQIAPAAIIEWLIRGGTFTMPLLKQRTSWRRWVKERALSVLPILGGVGIAVGIVLGWLLRILWSS